MSNVQGIGKLIAGIDKIGDDLFSSDEERLKISLKEQAADAQRARPEDIRKAKNASVFVAGWRPLIGWVGVLTLAYQFIFHPLIAWAWSFLQSNGWIADTLRAPAAFTAQELWVVLVVTLGVAALRSFDKLKGIDTTRVGKATAKDNAGTDSESRS